MHHPRKRASGDRLVGDDGHGLADGDHPRFRRAPRLGDPLLALTFAAVTFRLYLPTFPILGLPFVNRYRAASIYAWLINLGVAEWIARRSGRTVNLRASVIGENPNDRGELVSPVLAHG